MQSSNRRLLQVAGLALLVLLAGRSATAATFTVTNRDWIGVGSLYQAILDANATSGTDRIEFSIAGAGVQTIQPLIGLPVITDAVDIDGFTQPGSNAAANPPLVMVELNGDLLSEGAQDALFVGGVFSAMTIRGLAINGAFANGIRIQSSSQVTVEGCYIGTNTTGTADQGVNGHGILLDSATSLCTIGGTLVNHIGGNGGDGIHIEGADGITVQNNRIGVQSNGTSAVGNVGHGVSVDFYFFSNGSLIGGTAAGQGNTIGFNGGDGVSLPSAMMTTDQVRILGNDIFSNTGLGIDLNNDGTTLNDPGDADVGNNALQNFPVLRTATINPAGTQLTVDGWAPAGSSIELFRGDQQAAGVFGEGTFLTRFDEGGASDTDGTLSNIDVPTNGVNQGFGLTNRFRVTMALPAGVAGGTYLTSTATLGNRTSEFSATVRVLGNVVSLAYIQQPTDAAAGVAIAPAIGLELLDAAGQRVTQDSTTQVTLAIQTNPPGDGVLSGTVTATAVNGVVTYSDLSINKAGTGYRLRAAASGVTGVNSNLFNITAGAAARLAFVQQPTDAVAGTAISPAVTVRIEDALGNLVNVDGTTITIAIGNNPGGGTLAGTLSRATTGGVATFND